MKSYGEIKNLPFKELKGISQKTIDIHWGKLYQGYVKKWLELQEKLRAGATRDLKVEESFLADAVILHEAYFDMLGNPVSDTGNQVSNEIIKRIENDFGSFEKWQDEFKALGQASRGWVILAYDFNDGKLRNYIADSHNSFGIWGTAPLIVLDMYEHAYFLDFGTGKKEYIEAWFQNLNWEAVDKKFNKIVKR